MLSIAAGLIIGLLLGSFLNVVIYRLPVMLERDWRAQCRELLAAEEGNVPDDSAKPDEPFNLMTPRSRCPQCGAPVKAWQNIPVLSWLLLRGQCAGCKAPISPRYPIIELTTGLLSAVVTWHFGLTIPGALALLFVWALIALTMIDFDHQLLPDSITLPLLWLGLSTSVFMGADQGGPFPALQASVLGAMAGYLSLWSVYWLFKLATGKEGMGYGDFKLLAALGAWLGYQQLPLVIILSALVGAIVGVTLIMITRRDRQIPIPFGPYLAGAGFIALLWGKPIIETYLNYSGL